MAEARIQQLEAIEGWMWDPVESDLRYGMEQLKNYVEQNHHARVPQNHIDDDFKLGMWVSNRRKDYKNMKLETAIIQKLEAFEGWVWDTVGADFQYGIEQLNKYVEKNHHARVHQKYIDGDGFKLGKWVSGRRVDYNRKTLNQHFIQQLNAVEGWIWDPSEFDFQYGLGKLKEYVELYHHARVHQKHIDDEFALGKWVSHRRNDYKQEKLTKARIKQLEAIEGWIWDPSEFDFQYGLRQLKKYVEQNHNTRVHKNHINDDGFKLGVWVTNLRRSYKKQTLDLDRIQQLESVAGWVWSA